MMLISVVIPVYNTKDYLRQCVESVLESDTADCEILLVDDGSTDGESPALCDKLAEEYPAVRVIHQQNKGLGGARNTGIAESKGEYLFFVDSDDTVVAGALDVLKTELARTKAEVLSFDLYSDNGVRTPMNANACYPEGVFTLAEQPAFLNSMPSAWSRLWKKTLFTQNGILYPDRVWYEDIRTTTKLFAKAESIAVLKQPLYVYYQREGSIMHSSNLDRNREIIDAFEDLLGWYREQGLFEQYRTELCRLCIEHVYLAASVRVLRGDVKHPLLKELASYLRQEFPQYRKEDLSFLPGSRRLIFNLLEKRMYWVIRLLFSIKK